MDKIDEITFYQRTLNMLFKYLPELNGSQLKCLVVIAFLTVKENLKKVTLKIDQLEILAGMSRKTVIKTLNELSNFSLIEIDRSSQVHSYSIQRDVIHSLSMVRLEQDKIRQSVISKQKRVEQLYFESLELPPEAKKVFDLWNTYIHKWLDIHDENHLKYIEQSLKRVSVDNHLKGISKLITYENLDEIQFDESYLQNLFSYEKESEG